MALNIKVDADEFTGVKNFSFPPSDSAGLPISFSSGSAALDGKLTYRFRAIHTPADSSTMFLFTVIRLGESWNWMRDNTTYLLIDGKSEVAVNPQQTDVVRNNPMYHVIEVENMIVPEERLQELLDAKVAKIKIGAYATELTSTMLSQFKEFHDFVVAN